MADNFNVLANFQEITDEMVAKVAEALQNATNLVQVETGGNLGMLAFAPDLARAPVGDLPALQTKLQVQNVAGRATLGRADGRVLLDGARGLGGLNQVSASNDLAQMDVINEFIAWYNSIPASAPGFLSQRVGGLKLSTQTGAYQFNGFLLIDENGEFAIGSSRAGLSSASFYKGLSTRNTTVDSNGFVKTASPIFRLSNAAEAALADGLNFVEAGAGAANDEAPGVTATHDDVGVYTLRGSLGFATEGWIIEIPQCINGNRMVFVETEQADDGTITVRTFKPKAVDGVNTAGEPANIPDGRFITLRLSMPEPPSDEYPDDEPTPELTPEQQEQQRLEQLERWRNSASITPRQARLVLSRHGLLKEVATAISGIEDDQEREIVEIEWEYANSIERASAWVNTLYAALGLSQEDVDDLFLEAAQI